MGSTLLQSRREKQVNDKKRDEREYRQWRAFRKSKRGKVCIDRTPLRILEDADAKLRIHGTAIVVMPQLTTRDRRKAFLHFCRTNAIGLVAVEETGIDAPGCEGKMRPESRVTAYLAYGTKEALWTLRGHEYIRIDGDWFYPTNQKPLGGMCQLAKKPKEQGKDDYVATDASGHEQTKRDAEQQREEIASAYRQSDKWIAENVESVEDEEGLHMLRETLCAWFCQEALPPADLDTLGEFMQTLEWK